MSTTAFVSSTFTTTWLTASPSRFHLNRPLNTTRRATPSTRTVPVRRRVLSPRMIGDDPITTDAKPAGTNPSPSTSPAEANGESSSTSDAENSDDTGMPSLDTTVFSDFVENAQAKVDEWQQQLQEIDFEDAQATITDSAMGLVDNFLAGDWLNRGELYGALQLVAVFGLLMGGGLLDNIVSLMAGPGLLVVGAYASIKAVADLGRKQLSIWPAPVPDGELKTGGIYDLVRHPMYMGLLLASAGFAVSTGSPSRIAITVGIAALLAKKIEVEEGFLLEHYPDYQDYMMKVPYKVFPKIY